MRRLLYVLAVTGAVFAAAPAALQAQPAPPTLTDETLATAGGGEGIFETSHSCDPTGESTFSYSATGVAAGPYSGTFTESGTVRMGAPIEGTGGLRPILAFDASFTIDSALGLVTGTKRLAPVQPPEADAVSACIDTPEEQNFGSEKTLTLLDYEAKIQAVTGTFRDRGTALTNLLVGDLPLLNFHFGGLVELFTSDLPEPEPSTPASGDDCQDGGWENVFRADGSAFKNQGDCLQYVNRGK